MQRAHYAVPPAERADTARKLIDASSNPEVEVRTSDSGFYVPEELWDRVFPPLDADQADEDGEKQGGAKQRNRPRS